MDDTKAQWDRIEAALDELLGMPETARPAAIQRIADNDQELQRQLESLLAQMGGDDPLLDHPPVLSADEPAQPQGSLKTGARIGPYRILSLIGRGGMGEVYRAERADGQYQQLVALKLIRHELIDQVPRFQSERQMLARLDHPGIARLLDGGIADDDRPYMVMELVDGLSIIDWCRERQSTLAERLRLFVSICEAVDYAHRSLVVHRDIKPGNVLVTNDGKVKLLDFGIARLIGIGDETQTRSAPLTPGYAAPEQLTHGQVTTATDVYALGILLFELLTGERPWQLTGLPLVAALHKVLNETPPLPSRCAGKLDKPPLPPRTLHGDLDAIFAKAVRKEPQARYPDARSLAEDIHRVIDHEPVQAMEGARLYILRRYLRRNWLPLSAVAAVFFALLAGIVGIRFEAVRAQREAAKATAVKDFLVNVFRSSDPRIAKDKASDEITARALLDAGATRIDKDFSAQPELQIELLGLVADIYGYLNNTERYETLQKRRIELARRYYGPTHPIVLEGLITDAWASIYGQDYTTANRELGEIDRLLDSSGQDHSLLRAQWWLAKEQALKGTSGSLQKRTEAVDRAIALYSSLSAHNDEYAAALANAATLRSLHEDYAGACERNRQAIAIEQTANDRDDGDLLMMFRNLAACEQAQGQFTAAEDDYERAANLQRKTYGEHNGLYWYIQASHALMLQMRGERERAHTMFRQMLDTITPGWTATTDDTLAREFYAESLTAEGRASEAIPLLEAARKVYETRPQLDSDMRRVRQALGDAYDRLGNVANARVNLEAALNDASVASQPGNEAILNLDERWARFLLAHAMHSDADFEVADVDLRKLQAQIGSRPLIESAMVHADLARLALAKGDLAAAERESSTALVALDHATGSYDVRDRPYVWSVRGNVELAQGKIAEARSFAMKSLDALRRYDDPASPDIAAALAALRSIDLATR